MRISIRNAVKSREDNSTEFGSNSITLARSTSSKLDFKSWASGIQKRSKDDTKKPSDKQITITAETREQLSAVDDICIQIDTEEILNQSIKVTVAKSLSTFNNLLS